MADSTTRPGLVYRFARFMAEDKWWWITPIIVIVVLIGAFLVFVENSTMAPFIYSMF